MEFSTFARRSQGRKTLQILLKTSYCYSDVHSIYSNFEFQVVPGETVLAFYSAQNPTDQPISGISTYNVVPYEAGQYFNKIQCFCFDEQQLNPHEQVIISSIKLYSNVPQIIQIKLF